MKRIGTLLVAVCLLLTLIPAVAVSAAPAVYPVTINGGLVYLESDVHSYISYDGYHLEADIPDTVTPITEAAVGTTLVVMRGTTVAEIHGGNEPPCHKFNVWTANFEGLIYNGNESKKLFPFEMPDPSLLGKTELILTANFIGDAHTPVGTWKAKKKATMPTMEQIQEGREKEADGIKVALCAVCNTEVEEVVTRISTVTLSKTVMAYTGKALKPTAVVKDFAGKVLKAGTDYSMSYTNNIKVGTAKATVTFKGLYSGSKTLSFKIANPIAKAKITLAKTSMVYTGKALTPAVTVKYGTKTLKKGTDYTVAYKNNKVPGKATVTVKGKGNYTGSVAKTFNITPKAPAVSLSTASKKVTAKWGKVTGATGYEVQLATNKAISKGVKKATLTGTSKAFSSLKKGTTYYVRARAYKTASGSKIYSAWSTVKYIKCK